CSIIDVHSASGLRLRLRLSGPRDTPAVLVRLVRCFSFLTLPPPPRSTLFPYTTLFRSLPEHAASAGDRPVAALDAAVRLIAIVADRKSTRLNSSHVSISYAVFCLKKKTGGANSPRRRFCRRPVAARNRTAPGVARGLPF